MNKILIDEATVRLVLEALNSVSPRHLTPFISSARAALREAFTAPTTTETNGGKTGWPPGLLQDDSKGLSKWLSNQPDAKRRVREALAEPPAQQEPKNGLRLQDIRVEMYPPQPTSGMVAGMSKGVRLIHTPTGTIVECDTERSQHRNREVALKKLEAALAQQPAQQQSCYCSNCESLSKQVTALKTCLEVERGFHAQEQPTQQEPVGTYGEIFESMRSLLQSGRQADQQVYMAMRDKLLYTAPQPAQRTWVGLTEDEVFAVSNTMPYGDRFNFAEAIEAKLRSKNT